MPTVFLIFQCYPTCPGSESWAQSHHRLGSNASLWKCPSHPAICGFGGWSHIPPVEAEQEGNTNGCLYGQNVPASQPSPKQLVAWRAGSLRQRGQQGGPGPPSLGHAHMHSDLSLLLSSHVLGQISACEGAYPGLEMFCSGVGACQSTLSFSILGPHKELLRTEDTAIH